MLLEPPYIRTVHHTVVRNREYITLVTHTIDAEHIERATPLEEAYESLVPYIKDLNEVTVSFSHTQSYNEFDSCETYFIINGTRLATEEETKACKELQRRARERNKRELERVRKAREEEETAEREEALHLIKKHYPHVVCYL